MSQTPLAWVEISRSALLENARLFKSLIGPQRQLMAVVKGNAYGHGLITTAQIVQRVVDWFGVVNLDEAFELRRQRIRKPVLVLSYYQPAQAAAAIQRRIDLVIGSFEQLHSLVRSTQRLSGRLRVHVKCDVGTSRIGFSPKAVPQAVHIIRKTPRLKLAGFLAHFADSENRDQAFTNSQNEQFNELSQRLESSLGPLGVKHIACTAAALVNPGTRHDLIRVGLGLYGLWPSPSSRIRAPSAIRQALRPALTWKTRLISIKKLPAGTTIGYDRTYQLKKAAWVGVLPIGYYEGYPRLLSNRARVLIRGQSASVIGRVCMNLTMIDLSGIPKAAIGDEVVLIGHQSRGEVAAEELAKLSQTINYEIVARINPFLPRLIVN